MNELLNGIFGDDLKKYLPIIIIVVILLILYMLTQKDKGIMDLVKDFPISNLLGYSK